MQISNYSARSSSFGAKLKIEQYHIKKERYNNSEVKEIQEIFQKKTANQRGTLLWRMDDGHYDNFWCKQKVGFDSHIAGRMRQTNNLTELAENLVNVFKKLKNLRKTEDKIRAKSIAFDKYKLDTRKNLLDSFSENMSVDSSSLPTFRPYYRDDLNFYSPEDLNL